MIAEFVFETAPYPSCHASTIAACRGELVCAWFGGTEERHPDVGIWLARREAGRWSDPVEAADGVQPDGARFPCWNPVLFQPAGGPLLLFYKIGPSPRAWWGALLRSEDGGRSWSRPERLPAGILGPIKNKPLELDGGEILCPSSDEQRGWRVHFERTADRGRTWQTTGPINDGVEIAAIQPSLLVHRDGRLQAIGRTRNGRLFTTESRDSGFAWSPLSLLDVPNPDSGTDAVTLEDGRFLLVTNPTETGRTPLCVAVSEDGAAWRQVIVLESEEGEYSYPAIIQAPDRRIHITYTWRRQRIKHVELDPDDIESATRGIHAVE